MLLHTSLNSFLKIPLNQTFFLSSKWFFSFFINSNFLHFSYSDLFNSFLFWCICVDFLFCIDCFFLDGALGKVSINFFFFKLRIMGNIGVLWGLPPVRDLAWAKILRLVVLKVWPSLYNYSHFNHAHFKLFYCIICFFKFLMFGLPACSIFINLIWPININFNSMYMALLKNCIHFLSLGFLQTNQSQFYLPK